MTKKPNAKSTKAKSHNRFSLSPTHPTSYFQKTRDLLTSLVFVLPIFVIYQLGILTTGGLQNGVDFVTGTMMQLSNGSISTYILINLVILVICGGLFAFLKRRGDVYLYVYPGVLLESAVYASLLGGFIVSVMSHLGLGRLLAADGGVLAETGVWTNIIMSLGAGLYEETVFRLFLMGGLYYLGTRIWKKNVWISALLAVLISSLIFSAIHYVGPLGDPFQLGSFIFRFLAGIVFAVLFYTRGFATAVYTHAFYDIIVLVFR